MRYLCVTYAYISQIEASPSRKTLALFLLDKSRTVSAGRVPDFGGGRVLHQFHYGGSFTDDLRQKRKKTAANACNFHKFYDAFGSDAFLGRILHSFGDKKFMLCMEMFAKHIINNAQAHVHSRVCVRGCVCVCVVIGEIQSHTLWMGAMQHLVPVARQQWAHRLFYFVLQYKIKI